MSSAVTYTYEQISQALNAGVSRVLNSFDYSERDDELTSLVALTALAALQRPDVTLDEVIKVNCGSSPERVKSRLRQS